jgi:hypothetical protein
MVIDMRGWFWLAYAATIMLLAYALWHWLV